MYFDTHGLITTRNYDSGDCYGRHMGMRFIHIVLERMGFKPLFEFPNNPWEDIKWLGPDEKGICVRSPDEGPNDWKWNNPANFSRDQMIPGILYFGEFNHIPLERLFKACLKRWMRSQNGDVLWATWNLWARAFKKHLWVCWIFDLAILVDVLAVCGWLPRYKHDFDFGDGKRGGKWLWGSDPDWVDPDPNLFLVLTQAKLVYDTPISKLCRSLYSRHRQECWGTKTLGEIHPVMAALAWYHRCNMTTNFGNPDYAQACRPIVYNWF